ncbi:tyrosine-type recombinase/integrase [Kitasatospora sp. NPDC101235]|uniref:tyrosine-type recombinase/integrase n=1 Tax=Kitasatospora sp. NPDC101235 TaxID=3364101 RepID=UPI0037FAC85F
MPVVAVEQLRTVGEAAQVRLQHPGRGGVASASTTSATPTSPASSTPDSPANEAASPSTRSSPPSPAHSATPSDTTAWPATPPGQPSSPVRPLPNATSGQRPKPSASSATATPSTHPSPISSSCSSAPACAKAKPSHSNWVAISPRVATALRNRADDRAPATTTAPGGGLVFHRPDGRPLHPEYVLNHFHDLSRDVGVSRTTIHDLRHLAATISISAGVPLTVVSKTLRHSTLSTTANIYSHLTTQAARDAVDTTPSTESTLPRLGSPSRDHPATTIRSSTTNSPSPRGGKEQRVTKTLPSRRQSAATTMRPPADGTTERPPPPSGGNGLRPAVKQVGTTGFEPATP